MNNGHPPPPAVELIGISKRYKNEMALDNFSLSIPKGTTMGLIGPNGAGKSTTIRILMGTLRATAGTVRVLGMEMPDMSDQVRPRIGYVPERHDIYPWMTIAEVLRFTSSFYQTWDQDFCSEMMDLFALDKKKKVKHLSKGMQVKLALILGVAHRPELLILDEPTSGLDPIVHEDFLEGVLKAIVQGDTTVLFSSHNLGDIRRLADNVCILRGGKLMVQRGIEDLLASAKRVRAVLTDGKLPVWVPQGTIWQQIQRREWLLTIDGANAEMAARIKEENPVESVEILDLSLSDLFRDYIVGEGVKS